MGYNSIEKAFEEKKMRQFMTGLLGIIGLIVVAFGLFILWLHVTEYDPAPREDLLVKSIAPEKVEMEKDITILSFNIGYGALSKDMDFVMDGGKMSYPESSQIVYQNMEGVKEALTSIQPDIFMIQEIDRDSKRSYHMDQVAYLEEALELPGVYAANFRCRYVPFPIPRMLGKIESGLAVFHGYTVENADRVALPVPFQWPVRLAQLKRCLLVEYIPIEGTDKKLVLMNLHLEAYDDGGGRAAQTAALARLMEDEYNKGNYVIAGGDWNQTFPGSDLTRYPLVDTETFRAGEIDETLWDQWEFHYDESVPTSRLLNQPYQPEHPKTQYYVIDGFATSPNVQVEEILTIDQEFQFSDHNPV